MRGWERGGYGGGEWEGRWKGVVEGNVIELTDFGRRSALCFDRHYGNKILIERNFTTINHPAGRNVNNDNKIN